MAAIIELHFQLLKQQQHLYQHQMITTLFIRDFVSVELLKKKIRISNPYKVKKFRLLLSELSEEIAA